MNDFVNVLNSNGGHIYVVGGFIRNKFYNKLNNANIPTKDIDILVRCLDEDKIIELLQDLGTIKKIGISFGILMFKPNDQNETFEIALPRKEISIGEQYRDFEIEIDPNLSIEEELKRRDFTINAMCIEINSLKDVNNINFDNLIDPYHGSEDLKNNICRCVGVPIDRFKDDPTRILRAFRISTQLNLNLENNTKIAIKDNANLLNNLIPKSAVRLYNELFKMLKFEDSNKNLVIMKELNILETIGLNIEDKTLYIHTQDYLIKIALLLSNISHTNFDEWRRYYQISAVDNINKFDITFLDLTHNEQIIDLLINVNDKYDMLNLINKVEKISNDNNSYQLVEKLIIFVNIKYSSDFVTHYNLHSECNNYPNSVCKININGNEIKEITNSQGKEISVIKNKLLDDIYKDKVKNINEELRKYLELEIKL